MRDLPLASPFKTSLVATSLAALGITVVDALAVVSHQAHGRLSTTLSIIGYLWLAYIIAAGLTAAGLGTILVIVNRLRRAAPISLPEPHRKIDLAAAAALVVPVSSAGLYAGVLVGMKSFHNHELATLLLVLSAVLGLGFAIIAWLFLVKLSARLRTILTRRHGPQTRWRWLVIVPGAVLCAALITWAVVRNRGGLAQLNGWLWWTSIAGLATLGVGFWLAARYRWLKRRALTLWLALVALGLLTHKWLADDDGRLASIIVQRSSWSRYLLRGIWVVTDWDGDGYSSLFGGGDCGAWDRAIHPGAPEIPNDGIDNNCIGGDQGTAAAVTRPRYHSALPSTLEQTRNVLLITVEAVRADHVSYAGYRRPTTPRLKALAADAFIFTRMFASSSATRLSLPALLSSCAPSEIDWQPQAWAKQMRHIKASTPWLPSLLRDVGYRTIAVLTDFRAYTKVETAGLDRGFEHYDTSTHLNYRGGTMYGFPSRVQIDKAIAFLQRADSRPFFLWMHLMEPHFAYEQAPGAPKFGNDELARYDAEIWEVDRQVGRLLEFLSAQGLRDKTIFWFSGDHGEEFGEHGQRWHNSNLYDPQVRTAALLRVPGIPGRTIYDAAGFTDLAPTLLNLLRINQGFDQLRGRNLTPLLLGGQVEPDHFVLEFFTVNEARNFSAALVRWPYKLLYTERGRRFQLFDLQTDPAEARPLAAEAVLKSMKHNLIGYVERTAASRRIR